MAFTIKQSITPKRVGSQKATSVHLRLFVSFLIVSRVVAHGQWQSENIIKQTAVFTLHPFATRSEKSADVPPTSLITALDESGERRQ